MQEYDVKRGHAANVDLPGLLKECFGECREEGEWLTASFGAMPAIKARMDGKTKLVVDTEMDRKASTEDAQRTIKAWNSFLERATGFTAKQRSKRLQEKAKKGAA